MNEKDSRFMFKLCCILVRKLGGEVLVRQEEVLEQMDAERTDTHELEIYEPAGLLGDGFYVRIKVKESSNA